MSPGYRKRKCQHIGLLMILLIFQPLAVLFSVSSNAEDVPKVITISDGLKFATENSRIIKIASRNKDISYSNTLVAKSRLLPRIDTSASQTFLAYQPGARFGPQVVRTADKEFFSYGINVYQTVYDFGERSSQYEASKISLDSTKLDIERIKNLVALDFVIAYLDILEAEKFILVAQKEVERIESHLKVAQSLYDEGVITRNDLLQAEVRLSDAKQKLLTSRNTRAINASRVNNILALPLGYEIQVVEITDDLSVKIELDKAWETAEKQRFELSFVDNQLKINRLEETAKKSEYFPTFFAQGGYDFTENRFQLHQDNWSLIAGLNLNLFSGGSTRAELSRLRYIREQLLEQRRKLVDDIKLEVEKSYRDMRNADEKIRVTKDAVRQAEENLRINKIKYEEGVGTATDVIDSITLLTITETNYYRAIYEFKRAQAGLMYAMGQDLVPAYTH
ncbi:MAG: TolC family protein [Nitrospirota bacterium]